MFCGMCLHKYIENLVSTGDWRVKCLAVSGCREVIPIEALKGKVSQFLIDRLVESEVASHRSRRDGFVTCHFCRHQNRIDRLEREILRCRHCGWATCPRCERPSHVGADCTADRAQKQALAEEAANSGLAWCCSKCEREFVRDGGCNKLTCPFCDIEYCVVCKKELRTGEGYIHFTSGLGVPAPGTCPLWCADEFEADQ
jgi:TRIAD3 protein (E3 ubiquitin-protein ligase RNF216)